MPRERYKRPDHNGWITTAQAAKMLNLSHQYFRDVYCKPAAPLVTIRQRICPSGRRSLLVSRAAIEKVIEAETIHPKRS